MQIIRALLDNRGGSPAEIVKSLSLGKAEDDAVQKGVREAVTKSAATVADYRAGSERALKLYRGPGDEEDQGQGGCGRGAPVGEGGGGKGLIPLFSAGVE